jgi:hypothetical protein
MHIVVNLYVDVIIPFSILMSCSSCVCHIVYRGFFLVLCTTSLEMCVRVVCHTYSHMVICLDLELVLFMRTHINGKNVNIKSTGDSV